MSGSDEIEKVPNWEDTWVDKVSGMPIMGALTGSNPDFQNAVLRNIRLQDKVIHKTDKGLVVRKFDTRWEGHVSYTKWWDECLECGKKFNETDYE